jgi:hypothetical protein
MEDFGHFTGNNFSSFGEDYLGNLYVAGLKSGALFLVLDKTVTTGENEVSNNVRIIQNTYSSKIRVEKKYSGQKLMNLMVYDTKGSVVLSQSTRQNNIDINPGDLTAGIYFLKIMIDGRPFVYKLKLGR